MIDTVKHEEKLKEYEDRKKQLMIYTDRGEKHPYGEYKFRQKDWQTRRFIKDAKEAGWTLSSMKEIYDEAMEEVKRMRAVFDSHGECHLCGFRLDEHYFDHELPCKHVEVIE